MGNKRKISITRALAEVKLLESKLNNQFGGFDVKINNKLRYAQAYTEDGFIKEAKSELQSFESLFNNRLQIKAAIALANIETSVELQGKSYKIIELIDLKSSASYKETLLKNLIGQYQRCKQECEKLTIDIELEVSKQVESANGNKNQVSKDLAESLTKTYTDLRGGNIIGLDIIKIEKDLKDLTELRADIDMTLSEINAKTEIEVEL